MPADNFTRRTFPRLTSWCLREKAKRSADIFSGLDGLVFHFGGEKSSADNFGAEHLSYFDSFDFRRKNNARQTIFRGLTVLFFILAENFTDRQFRRRFSIKLDKILRIMNLEKYNESNEWLAANKNYMSSLAAEGVRSGVLASAVDRSTVGRSEFQPCI